jgi:uncharacterized protein (DUF1501 family)
VFCVGDSGELPATLNPGAAPGLGAQSTSDAVARMQALHDVLALDSGATLMTKASETTAEGLRQADELTVALAGRPALQTTFPSTELGQQLRQIAQVISVRQTLGISRQIFFCSLGGFDTHVGQTEKHSKLLAQLSEAVKAFYDATLELGVDQNVTTFTHSEFGRTLLPNTSSGTDHAWGGHQFVIGGSVRGGEVYGRYPTLQLGGADDATNRGVLIPTTSVDQYVATLASWVGVSASDVSAMLPNLANFATRNLGFLS